MVRGKEEVNEVQPRDLIYCLRTTNSRIIPTSQGSCMDPDPPQLSAIIHAPDTKGNMTPGIMTLS